MNPRKIVTEITIETDQVLVVRRRQVIRRWCAACRAETEFIRREEGNHPLDLGRNQGNVVTASGSPHFAKAPDGSLMICIRSFWGADNVWEAASGNSHLK